MQAIEDAPLLQQQDVIKHYIGIHIACQGKLFRVDTKETDLVRVSISCDEPSQHYLVFAEVNPRNYSGLGILKRGTTVQVSGTIREINPNLNTISLSEPTLQF